MRIGGIVLGAALAALMVVAAGCPGGEKAPAGGEGGEGGGAAAKGASGAGVFEAVRLEAAPEGAVAVAALKKDAKEGDEVVLRGRIGGTPDPFVEGRAVMTLADEKEIVACNENPEDGCQTPWDYCCETPEKITASTLTVQVVGEDGQPLRADLREMAGVKELSTVVVKGTVGARPDPAVLIVNATGIYVER